jgi:hypothetical protein
MMRCIPALVSVLGFASALVLPTFAATYYVAPTGSDAHPGSVSQPWATAKKAAQMAAAGDTVIFENGTYNETSATKFTNSGSAGAPIIFKARNKHLAVLRYIGRLNVQKLMIDSGKEYITIQDFEITQDGDASTGTTSDYMVQTEAHHTSIIGNKIHNVFEDGIKVSGNGSGGTGHVLIEGNIVYDVEHEGIDAVRMWSSTVRFNEVYQVNRVGIMLKGGIRSVLVYGNRVHSPSTSGDQGITIGGSSDAQWSFDPYGWEAYNCYGWSNIVEGPWNGAISLRGAKDSAFFNNTIVGANQALMTQKGGKTSGAIGTYRWYWTATGPIPVGANPANYTITGTPLNQNVWFKNNIVVAAGNANAYATKFESDSLLGGGSTLAIDYNLYHGYVTSGTGQRLVAGGAIDKGLEANGSYGSAPGFVTNYTDLHLQPGSAAIDTATAISGLTGFFGEAIVATADADNVVRTGAWDRGAYNHTAAVTLPFTDDFEDSTIYPWSVLNGTWSIVTDGTKVLRQTTTTGDAFALLAGGWGSQCVQARVKVLSFNGSDRHASVYARYTDADNHYYLQLRSGNTVELRKKVGGTVTTLQSVAFTVATNTWYDLRLDVVGTQLRGFVNGVQRVSATDSALATGGVALGMFNASAQFDDISISATPPPTVLLLEDFEDNVANGFTTSGGTWAVATDGTKVYRQSSTTVADAWAYHGTSWTDQIVAVDMKPISFNGTNRHVSVYARWTDSNNHYYLALRNSNTIELKKKVGGTVTTLDSDTFTVATGTWYALKLEVLGTTLKAYINGVERLSATDSTLASGSVALGSYGGSASFGDVLVTAP